MTIAELAAETAGGTDPASEEAIRAVEKHAGGQLSADYREFLVRCNGGLLDGRFTALGVAPDCLFGIRDDEEHLSLWAAIRAFPWCVKAGMVPIARERSGRVIGLSVRGADAGAVYVWENRRHERVAGSLREFAEALQPVEPDVAYECYRRGADQLAAGQAKEALEALRQSWTVSEHAATAHRIGAALIALGRREEAADWLARAYNMNPRHGLYGTEHAAALHLSGRSDEAAVVLRGVLDTNSTYGPARRLLDRITSR